MAKGNNFWVKFFIGILSVVIVLLAFAKAYGILDQKVERNCEDIEKHEVKIGTLGESVVEQGTDIKYLIKGQENMQETLDKIEKKL